MLNSILLGCISFGLFVWWWVKRQKKFFETIPPGPMPWPLIGNLPHIMHVTDRECTNLGFEFAKKYGTPFTLSFGPVVPNGVIIDKPEHLQIIVNSKAALNKPHILYSRLTGIQNGLVTLPSDIWQQHRKAIQPVFGPKQIHNLLENFIKSSKILSTRLEKYVDQKPFHCEFDISVCTLSTVIEGICKVDPELMGEEVLKDIVKISLDELPLISQRVASVFNGLFHKFTPSGRRSLEKEKRGIGYVKLLIELYEKNKGKTSNVDDDTSSQPNFLDIIQTFNEAEIVGEIKTLCLAGFSTIALTISYTLVMLGMHPEYQEKAYEEILSVMGESDRPIEHNDLHRIPYTEACLKEALRLFPPIPAYCRQLSAPVTLDKYTLPAGTLVACLMCRTHRREDIYPNPNVYNPDNFSIENSSRRHPYSFLPFVGGSRNCIGNRYSMMFLKVLAITLLKKYKVSTDMKMEELGINRLFTIEGEHLRISLKRRVEKNVNNNN